VIWFGLYEIVAMMVLTEMPNQIFAGYPQVASSIHMWSYLLSPEQRGPVDARCNRLMVVVWTTFNHGGWLHSNHIENA
jgi:hypothetical protein